MLFVTIFFLFFFASFPSWCSLYAQNPSREGTREQNEKKNTKVSLEENGTVGKIVSRDVCRADIFLL